MRIVFFRVLAGLVVALMALAVVLSIRNGTIGEGLTITVAIGALFILPSIAVYAIAGPRAANWLLVRSLNLLGLPERLANRVLAKRLQIPDELTDNSVQWGMPSVTPPLLKS